MTSIGITGHSSFLGKHLVKRLQGMGLNLVVFDGDIRNPYDVAEFVKHCRVIYHLAGCNRGEEKDVFEVNMVGGANVMAASAALGNRHIIFPSSNYVSRFPSHPYSVSKKTMENLLTHLAGSNGCRATIFRLSNVYGPLALPFHVSVVATFCWYQAKGLGDFMPIIGDGSQPIEIVPIDKVINHLIQALDDKADLTERDLNGDLFSVAKLAEIIKDSSLRTQHSSIDEAVRFFTKESPVLLIEEGKVKKRDDGGFDVTTDHLLLPFTVMRCKELLPGYQRNDFESFEDGSVILSTGRVALDLFFSDGQYQDTVLIDGEGVSGAKLVQGYIYKLRNVSTEKVTVFYLVNGSKGSR